MRHITKRPSEDSRKEFSRLMRLKWETVVRYGSSAEVGEAKQLLLEENRQKGSKRMRLEGGDSRPTKKKRVCVGE